MCRLKYIILIILAVTLTSCLKVHLREGVDKSEVLVLKASDLECLTVPVGKNHANALVDLSKICQEFNRTELVYIRFNGMLAEPGQIDEIWCK